MSKLVFLWDNFGPLHVDRCEAVAAHFAGKHTVVGLEVASNSLQYDWNSESGSGFTKQTLITGRAVEQTGFFERFWAVFNACRKLGSDARFFLCHYQDPAILVTAALLRLLGRPVFTMGCSKFDDYKRNLGRELFKSIFYLPYQGGIASGIRSRGYMHFLGIPESRIKTPYNAVSIDRIRRMSGIAVAPEGQAFASRHFLIVARLLPKKNLTTALRAMRLYAEQNPNPRSLHIYGNGPLEAALREQADREGVSALVHFHGFAQTDVVSQAYGSALALLLPSIEEQYGNVIPEAIAMGLPVIVAENVGARDTLVRSGVNGFVIEPDNPEGLAFFMGLLANDEQLWGRMCLAAQQKAHHADAPRFAEAVESLLRELADR